MESGLKYKTLIDELTQGMEKANHLRVHLCSTSPDKAHDLLLQKIISCYENALLILNWSGSMGQVHLGAPTPVTLNLSVSGDPSPRSEDMNKNFRDHTDGRDTPKKRKMRPIWTEQVRVSSENGLEGPNDDRFSWRKYGQKDILGAKYPRSYYRCTYRHVRNCWATKQVQRSDEDTALFDITYKGTHTCKHSISAEKHEPMKYNISQNHQIKQQDQTLLDLKANLRVNTEDLDSNETKAHFSFPSTFACCDKESHYFVSDLADENIEGTFSSLVYSPATSASNYFSSQMSNYGGDIISAHASTTNSPIGGMGFSIDPNFQFDSTWNFT